MGINFLHESEENDYVICHFPHHREFIDLVRKAEAEAKETGERRHYLWRGYRGFVAPDLPRITVPGLQIRMMNALHKIQVKTVAETMVKKK